MILLHTWSIWFIHFVDYQLVVLNILHISRFFICIPLRNSLILNKQTKQVGQQKGLVCINEWKVMFDV